MIPFKVSAGFRKNRRQELRHDDSRGTALFNVNPTPAGAATEVIRAATFGAMLRRDVAPDSQHREP